MEYGEQGTDPSNVPMEDIEGLERPARGPNEYVITPSEHPHEWKSCKCQISASSHKVLPSLLTKRFTSVGKVSVEGWNASSTHDNGKHPEAEDNEGDQPSGDGATEKQTDRKSVV